MRRFFLVLAGILTVAAGVGLALYWSKARAEAYSGMAAHFPDSVAVFVEVRQVGQWMNLPADVQVQPEPIKNQDPLLGVLGRVWAAERISPQDLPVVLKDQPMAVGIWREGDAWKGAGLLAVTPTLRESLEQVLREKLGEGEVAGTVSGIQLRAADKPGCEGGMKLVWGVGDTFAVVATGVQEAGSVLASQARPLDTDPEFLEAASRFPLDKGGWVFVRGSAFKDLAQDMKKCSHDGGPEASGATEGEERAAPVPEAVKGSEEEGDTAEACGPEAGCCDGTATLLASLFPEGTVPPMALWSCPPPTPRGTWEVQMWVGRDEKGGGFFGALTEGGSRTPDLLAGVVKDGTLYCWAGGEEPAGLYKRVMDEFARRAPADKVSTVRAGIGALEGKLGLSLANDLLPTMGDEICVAFKEVPRADGAEGSEERFALYVSLRDSRRLVSLLREKVAPSVGLKEEDFKGNPSWTWSPEGAEKKAGEEAPRMVVEGSRLVVTPWPEWALGTGQAGKAWSVASQEGGKLSFLAVADPSAWDKVGSQPVVVTGTRGGEGILIKATFSGERPKIPLLEPDGEEAAVLQVPSEPSEPKEKAKAAA